MHFNENVGLNTISSFDRIDLSRQFNIWLPTKDETSEMTFLKLYCLFLYLYDKAHINIFICIYVSYSWPNDWTKLAEMGEHMGTHGVRKVLKNVFKNNFSSSSKFIFFFDFTGNARHFSKYLAHRYILICS